MINTEIQEYQEDKTLESLMPEVFKQLLQVKEKLEKHFHDVCDIEFTIQQGQLFILNVRPAKRTPLANLRFLFQFYYEGKIGLHELLVRVKIADIERLLVPEITNKVSLLPIGCALPASSGSATGKIVLDSSTAIQLARKGDRVILVKEEINPDDIEAIHLAHGVLTGRGGMTSHAAVVCRGLKKPCVAGFSQMSIERSLKQVVVCGGGIFHEMDWITINGSTGHVFAGRGNIKMVNWRDQPELLTLSQFIELATTRREVPPENIGAIWRIRDYFAHSFPLRRGRTSKRSAPSKPFISFTPPTKTGLKTSYENLTKILPEARENYSLILISLADTLARLLSSALGLGQHHRYFRPLWDPKSCVTRNDELSGSQFIGFEFFNVNNHIPHLVDISTITFLLDVNVEEESDEWFLDFTNPDGESLVSSSESVKAFTLLINDAPVAHEDLPLFYDSIRSREYYWRYYERNHTSYEEIVKFLKDWRCHKLERSPLLTLCFELGLIRDGELTLAGKSLAGR